MPRANPFTRAEDGLEEEARLIQDKHLEKDERGGLVSEYLDRLLPTNWGYVRPVPASKLAAGRRQRRNG